MANRFREFIESIVYVGMKPTGKPVAAPAAKPGLLGVLDRYFSSPASSDPLYLTNQTFSQKFRKILFVGVPVVAATGLAILLYVHYGPTGAAEKPLTREQVAAKVLPNFDAKKIQLEVNRKIDVTEVRFQHSGGDMLYGSLQNTSGEPIRQAEVVLDLADNMGTLVGSVTVTATDLKPGAVHNFQMPAPASAESAMVREVRTP